LLKLDDSIYKHIKTYCSEFLIIWCKSNRKIVIASKITSKIRDRKSEKEGAQWKSSFDHAKLIWRMNFELKRSSRETCTKKIKAR